MSYPLSPENVDSLFAQLVVTYGSAFRRQYEGTEPAVVKADWADKLAGLPFEAIEHALEHLPTKVPNVLEFRQLCRSWRSPETLALPAPHAAKIPPNVKAALTHLAAHRNDERPERVRWAQRFIGMWEGKPLAPYQRPFMTQARKVLEAWDRNQEEAFYAE